MTFEQALKDGDLAVARAMLDELAELPETGGLDMPECYADLARSYDRRAATCSTAPTPRTSPRSASRSD